MLLLLRILDPLASPKPEADSSVLSIDNVPLASIDRGSLRRRLIAVPQDPVFLPDGTSVRENLDPFVNTANSSSEDDDFRAVLEAVDLWTFVERRGGLDAGLTADTLSQGQKQLFGLARAMLRRRIRAKEIQVDEQGKQEATSPGGVLLLDEFSSSVDVETDKAMQSIIMREFEGYTIVMVSHRLDMVMGFDRVVVMDSGSVVEEGAPRTLVNKEGSRFRDLWLVGNRE
jgi:ABC-type multidrug transport system fused ATPase/permease subunit